MNIAVPDTVNRLSAANKQRLVNAVPELDSNGLICSVSLLQCFDRLVKLRRFAQLPE